MIKLEDLNDVSDWSLYTPNGERMDANFIMNNRNMLVDHIDIYIVNEPFGKSVMGLTVFLYDSIYEDTDSVVTP